jgi:hypothetical protein
MTTLRVWCGDCRHMTLHDQPEAPTQRPTGEDATGVRLRCVACSTKGNYAVSHVTAAALLAA